MTSLKPKHLNFDEMWKLYKTIKSGIPNTAERLVIDEISVILKGITNQEFLSALYILEPKYKTANALKASLLFTQGLINNRFFMFIEFIKGIISNGSPQ